MGFPLLVRCHLYIESGPLFSQNTRVSAPEWSIVMARSEWFDGPLSTLLPWKWFELNGMQGAPVEICVYI